MSTEKKLTAVEWLVEHLTEYCFNLKLHKLEIKKAKEKEKQQIIDAHYEDSIKPYSSSEQYYNETYKK